MGAELHVKMEAEAGRMQLQAKDSKDGWPPPVGGTKQGRIPPKVSEGTWPRGHLDFRPLEL